MNMDHHLVRYQEDGSTIVPVTYDTHLVPSPDNMAQLDIQPWEPPATTTIAPFPDIEQTMQNMQHDIEKMQRQMEEQMQQSFKHCQMMTPVPAPIPPLSVLPVVGYQNNMATGNAIALNSTATTNDVMSGPVVKETDEGDMVMEIGIQVQGYQPEDINIHSEGNLLRIHAKKMIKQQAPNSDSSMCQEFKREFTLPEGVQAENLRCRFGRDNILTIVGPLDDMSGTARRKKQVTFAINSKRNK